MKYAQAVGESRPLIAAKDAICVQLQANEVDMKAIQIK